MTLSATIHDMQKLTKKDRRRFDEVCRKIREALHLEHKQSRYSFTNDDTTAEAGTLSTANGWYLNIRIHPIFWEKDAEEQLRTLIHEHIHVAMIPYDQQVDWLMGRMHEADTALAKAATYKGCELAVCHLESVLFDLISDRF